MRKSSVVNTCIAATLVSTIVLTGCGSNSTTAGQSGGTSNKITLTFFTNNSDRTSGQGKIEQQLIDEYMKEHTNIDIKVETLSPDPQFQDKIKVYNASNSLPDIISSWGNTSFLQPLIKNNALAEINKDDLKNMNFIPAALDGFTSDGKLYGLPRNSDFWAMYYNKKIFQDNGISVPKTESELLDDINKLKAKNIVPIAMDGRDAWTSAIWFNTLVQRASGTWATTDKAMDRSGSFKDPAVIKAATEIQKLVKAGAFGDGFLNQDYAMARNMFGQGKAAMYMIGEWEMGIGTDANFPDDVKNNIGAFPIPALDGGAGSTGDLAAWFGGGYSISSKSPHKQEAITFLEWMFQPENWAKAVWQNGITFPAQKYDQFLTGKETNVQKDLTNIFSNAKSYSGTLAQDKFTSDTQKTYYDTIQKLESFNITPNDFANTVDATADKSSKESAK